MSRMIFLFFSSISFCNMSGLFQVTESGNLVIHNTQKSDAGEYVCRAVNMVGSKDSEPAKLSVQGT